MDGLISIEEAKASAKHAKECVRFIREWLPVGDHPGKASPSNVPFRKLTLKQKILGFWNPRTVEEVEEIAIHQGRSEVKFIGGLYPIDGWRELWLAMQDLGRHYAIMRGEGVSNLMQLSVDPVDELLLDRVEAAADEILDFESIEGETTPSRTYNPQTPRGKFLAEYERSRLSPKAFLEEGSNWTKQAKSFFSRLCGEKDGSKIEILKNAIKAEQKLRRQATKTSVA